MQGSIEADVLPTPVVISMEYRLFAKHSLSLPLSPQTTSAQPEAERTRISVGRVLSYFRSSSYLSSNSVVCDTGLPPSCPSPLFTRSRDKHMTWPHAVTLAQRVLINTLVYRHFRGAWFGSRVGTVSVCDICSQGHLSEVFFGYFRFLHTPLPSVGNHL